MTKGDFKKHLSGGRILAVWAIALLLVGLVCFLMMDNFRSRSRLQQKTQVEFLRNTQNIASGLVYFFEERKDDLNMLACSQSIVSYFKNQAMGMSMEDGLKASLLSVQENLDDMLKRKKIADQLIYRRFMLVGRDGKILLDCSWSGQKPGETQANLYSVFNGKPRQAIVALKHNDSVSAVVSVPCYLQEEYVAILLAVINPDSIVGKSGRPESLDEKSMMILDGNSLCLVNRTPETKTRLSVLQKNPVLSRELFYLESDSGARYLFANAPIANTSFYVINSAKSDYFHAENPREMLCIMTILASVLFGCGIYVYRSAAGNLILRVRLDEKNSQQQTLEQVNEQLKREVSHRRQKEVLLSEKEALLLATIESTSEGILVVDQDGQIASWNRSFRDIWKIPDIKLLSSLVEIKDFLLERTQNSESFVNEFCMLQDTTERFSGIIALKNTSILEYSARPMKVLDVPRGRVWTFRDITLHKCAEQSLQLAKEAAEQSNKAKTEFLANMSHELRTPLNAVIGFSEVLHEETLNDSQKAYVDNIHRSGMNLLEMLDNLLLYSDIEAGRVTREIRKCVLWDMINYAKKRIRAGLLKKNIQLDVICQKETPSTFYSDPYLITRILSAILDNACKFTEQGQIIVTLIHLVEDYQPFVRFVVEDTGIGIPEDKLEKIFEVFSQADGSMSRKYGGMGTGLPLVKKLVWLLGGKIQVQSEYGKGTTVTITLPVKDNDKCLPTSDAEDIKQAVAVGNPSGA